MPNQVFLSLVLHLHRNEDHDNIYLAVSPYNVVMAPRRSSRNRPVTSGPSSSTQLGTIVENQNLLPPPPPPTASEPMLSPTLTTTSVPHLTQRATTEDDVDSQFVLNWYVVLGGDATVIGQYDLITTPYAF